MKKIIKKLYNLIIRNLILKTLFFIFIFILGAVVSKQISHSFDDKYILGKKEYVKNMDAPKHWDATLGVYDEHLDHIIYYNNFFNVMDKVRTSDIIVLGNSQTLFGLHYQTLEPYLKDKNIKLYNMAFGHDENYLYPLKIMKKYKLRPKYIFIDAWIFKRPTISKYAQNVVTLDRFEAYKDVIEKNLSYEVLSTIHYYFPKISLTEPKRKKL